MNPSIQFFKDWDKHVDVMTKFWRPRPRHVIFADSRGTHLHKHIMKANKEGILFTVYHFGGNTIRQLIVRAEHHLMSYPRDYVYIFGGQCDITTMDRHTRKVSLDWYSEEALATHLTAYTEVGLDWVKHYHPEAQIVICPLTGCDVTKKVVNNRPGLQTMTDAAIQVYNKVVIEFNEETRVATAWTANHFFKERSGDIEMKYHLLGDDGIHPTDVLLAKWGVDFVNCFRKNPLMLTHDSCY